MRILITGGAGFIGSNFVDEITQRFPDSECIVIDKLTYAGDLRHLGAVKDRITFIKGDICNPEDLKKAGMCDTIFNFAAETHVDRSIDDASSFVRTDVLGTHTLLEYARRCDAEHFVQISTDEVYGSTTSGSFSEEDRFNPSSPYSASKAGGELLASAYYTTYGLPVKITRSSNNYGPCQYPEKLIPVLILNALENRELPLYGDGKNVRDWLYVKDNCEGIITVFKKGDVGEAYNIGAQCEVSNVDIARKILRILGKPESLIQFVNDRPGHDFRYSVNCEKIHGLGWHPRWPLDKGLELTVDWYRKNRGIWEL